MGRKGTPWKYNDLKKKWLKAAATYLLTSEQQSRALAFIYDEMSLPKYCSTTNDKGRDGFSSGQRVYVCVFAQAFEWLRNSKEKAQEVRQVKSTKEFVF